MIRWASSLAVACAIPLALNASSNDGVPEWVLPATFVAGYILSYVLASRVGLLIAASATAAAWSAVAVYAYGWSKPSCFDYCPDGPSTKALTLISLSLGAIVCVACLFGSNRKMDRTGTR